MLGYCHGQVLNDNNEFLALPAIEARIAAVEKRGCFAVPKLSVSDKQVDPIPCFDATEDAPH
jgi:hypothetical protein